MTGAAGAGAVLVDTAVTDLGRDEAQELARRELSKAEYHRDDPGFIQRAGEWLQDRLSDLVDSVDSSAPGGWVGLAVLVALAVIVVVLVVHRVGGVRTDAVSSAPLLAGRARTAAEHRADADRAAAEGHFDIAIRERLRAIARELETRGVLDARPGRTADELARDGGAALPGVATPLRAAVLAFDDVWYGGRTATAEAHATVLRADELVAGARSAARSTTR